MRHFKTNDVLSDRQCVCKEETSIPYATQIQVIVKKVLCRFCTVDDDDVDYSSFFIPS